MELIYLTVAVGAAFWGGWLTARTIHGDPRPRAAEDDAIAQDDFTRSINGWGRRYER